MTKRGPILSGILNEWKRRKGEWDERGWEGRERDSQVTVCVSQWEI